MLSFLYVCMYTHTYVYNAKPISVVQYLYLMSCDDSFTNCIYIWLNGVSVFVIVNICLCKTGLLNACTFTGNV